MRCISFVYQYHEKGFRMAILNRCAYFAHQGSNVDKPNVDKLTVRFVVVSKDFGGGLDFATANSHRYEPSRPEGAKLASSAVEFDDIDRENVWPQGGN
jgi:hypothetical protein